MTQRTLNIINICKGNTKYKHLFDNKPILDAVKEYMAEECADDVESYTPKVVLNIMLEAMYDYLTTCNNTKRFINDVLYAASDDDDRDIYKYDLAYGIAIAFQCAMVTNHKGYINGFDDRLHLLDREV